MVRQLFLPLLGLALLFSEAATAQTSPATAAKKPARTLTARERRAAKAAAKVAAATSAAAVAPPTQLAWSGWSDEPVALPQDDVLYHPRTNLSVAPGMPVNQVGHGVTTDYDGRPLRRAASTPTTLPLPR